MADISNRLSPPRPSYRRLQFSLRGLLMLLLAALTWLGYYADQVHRQQAACAAIRRLGGHCLIRSSDGSPEVLQRRLAEWLGEDAVQAVSEVYLGGCRVRDGDLAYLAGLPHVRTLILTSTPVTDAGLEHLRALKYLEHLDLRFSRVTPEGIERLRRDLPNSRIVYRSDLD